MTRLLCNISLLTYQGSNLHGNTVASIIIQVEIINIKIVF